MLYSKTTRGFYNHEIHGENIPDDCIEITDEYHIELINGQSNGKQISCDENGYPVLIDAIITRQKVTQVSMRQAQLALLKNDLLDDVESAVGSMSRDMQIAWDKSSVVNRDDCLVISMAELLGLSESQMDDLFEFANTL